VTPSELIEAVEEAGGTLELHGERVRYQMPTAATHLLEELRGQREEVKALLLERRISAALPPGVRLVSWHPKEPPIVLTQSSVVNDPVKFIEGTLRQLRYALDARRNCAYCRRLRGEPGPRISPSLDEVREHNRHSFLAGNWSIRDLVERLEQVGLLLEVERQ
jgi:hypothetical protein